MDKQKLLQYAAPLAFLASSFATTVTSAGNNWLLAGGIGLTAAAGTALACSVKESIGEKIGKLIPAFCLAANAPLAINGALLMGEGLTKGDFNTGMAGGLLAIANGAFYGLANARALTTGITAQDHAYKSMLAGFSIGAAGCALANPVLAVIGAGFTAEAFIRFQTASEPKYSPLKL